MQEQVQENQQPQNGQNGQEHTHKPIQSNPFAYEPQSRKRKTRVVLHFPSHDREVSVWKRLPANGRYVDEKAKIDVALQANMAVNNGGTIHIDGERGVQIKYAGLEGWKGIDGRYSFFAQVGKDAQDLQNVKMGEILKNLRLAIYVCAGCVGAFVIETLIFISKYKGG